ncbi:hypothetical protein [Arenimonas sp. GDDSR-1]|nr:hypothetical protein [Arenimonas sp. GDDSR-1]
MQSQAPVGRWLAITLGVGVLALIGAVVVWVVYPDVLIDAFIRLLPVVR